MRLTALLHPAAPARPGPRLVAGGLLAAMLAAGGTGALATAETAQDAAPQTEARQAGYQRTPTPAFLKRWHQASRRNGLRAGTDQYTGGLELQGPVPADYPVLVDGRRAGTGENLAALGPVHAVEVDRTFERASSPRTPRITQVRIQSAGAAQPAPVAGLASEARPMPTDAPMPIITRPNWAARPSGEDLARLYPAAAKAAGLPGRATLQCAVTAAGTLTRCSVASEAPEGAGFGAATLALADRFRMTPQTADGRPVDGGVVRVPVLWRLAEEPGPRADSGRSSEHRYTSTITHDEKDGPANIAVTVRSDRYEDQGGGRAVATGRVAVEAQGAPAGLFQVNGRPQPAGFDPRFLQGRIERVEIRNTEGEGQPAYNLITR